MTMDMSFMKLDIYGISKLLILDRISKDKWVVLYTAQCFSNSSPQIKMARRAIKLVRESLIAYDQEVTLAHDGFVLFAHPSPQVKRSQSIGFYRYSSIGFGTRGGIGLSSLKLAYVVFRGA